jgi:DNA-binding CsgD family transcriptional regulator
VAVGRRSEREALVAFLDDLATGPAALLLEGEPGIGKSTLWTEVVELARARGCRVLTCRPTGSDAELSFSGLSDLFREAPIEALAELPVPQAEALEVSLLRRPPGSHPPGPRAVSLAALSLLEVLAAGSPVAVAIDDAQWLDAATDRVLTFAIRRLPTGSVGFALTRSDADAPPPLGIQDAIDPSRFRRVPVGPLDADDLADLVQERIGRSMSLSEARRLADVSGGNPFFALEIARAAARGDRGVTGQSLPIPRNLRDDLVTRRLGAIPAASADLLLVAAAAGRPTLDVLRASGADDQLPVLLQHAIDAGLVQVVGTNVRFTHPIYRSVLYANASRSRRHDVHRRLSELTTDPEERARHLALSADATDEAIAAVLDEAAARARERGAPVAAAELTEHAIRLTPEGSSADARRRRLTAADHRFVAGDTGLAEEHARGALELSAAGSERAEALRSVAEVQLERGGIGEARRSLEAAESEADPLDPVAADAQRRLAELWLRSGELAVAERYARAAAERADLIGDPNLVLSARTTLARIGLWRGVEPGVLVRRPEATEAASDGAASDRFDLVQAEAAIAIGDHGFARDRLEALRDRATDNGDEPMRRSALVGLAELELRDGAWHRAEALARQARELADRLGVGGAVELSILAYVASLAGRADDARTGADLGLLRAGDDREAQLWALGAVGVLELSLGNAEPALRHLGRAGGLATEMGIDEPAAFPFFPDEAEALVVCGELAAAELRIRWLEERGVELGRDPALAAAARCRSLLFAGTGELSAALGSAANAVERYSVLPLPFERARSLLTLGTLRRRDRQKRASREALEDSLALFETLGAAIWAERAREELARISGRRAASVAELTEGETRVARLAAAGRTNREIARTLSMSVRTVEGHLSHAYAKLGLRSRTELAVFFERSD